MRDSQITIRFRLSGERLSVLLKYVSDNRIVDRFGELLGKDRACFCIVDSFIDGVRTGGTAV